MATVRDLGTRGQTLNMIDPRIIGVVPGLNARDVASPEIKAHIESLADSIAARGFLGSHPIEVFTDGDKVFVAAGHCRLAAAILAISRGVELRAIPCLSEARGTSPAQRLANQITSNSGQRLTLAEEGRVYSRLWALGNSVPHISELVGKSPSHIKNALDFHGAPAEAHTLVSEGKVSASLAAKVIRKEGATKGVAKLNAAVGRAKKAGKKKATAQHMHIAAIDPVSGAEYLDKNSDQLAKNIRKAVGRRDDFAALSKLAKAALDAWQLFGGHSQDTSDAMKALGEFLAAQEA